MSETINVTYTIEKLQPGLCIPMGKEGTWWRVLEVNLEEKSAVLIAEKSIANKKYHEKYEDITWENCTLRKWLNEEYFEKIFSDDEKEAIIETYISNPDNTQYGKNGGNNTKDRIWLLCLDELQTYFKDYADRATGDWWWLRSPGLNQGRAAFVQGDGDADYLGYYIDFRGGVRPAFKINLKSSFFQALIYSEKNGESVIRNPKL